MVIDMKILDFLKKEAVLVDLKAQDKRGVIKELASPVARIAGLPHEELVQVLMERERLGSTGIDGGIGIPHGKVKVLESPAIGFGLSRKGLDFESIDGRPTRIFFLLVTPEEATTFHLRLLAQITRILKNEPLRGRLLNAADPDEILSIIKEADEGF